MKGHVAKKESRRGRRYYPVVDLGHETAQRCTACGRRAGWASQGRLAECARCGGELVEKIERRQHWGEGHARKQDAERALRVILKERDDGGDYVSPSNITLADFLRDQWLPSLAGDVRPTTFLSYQCHVEHHIIPTLGDVPLRKITTPAIKTLFAKLASSGRVDRDGGLSPATVRRVHATLHRALREAVEWNLIARNPADKARPAKASADAPREMVTWTPEELRAFLDHVRDDRLAALWTLFATTGLRRGEALGLSWSNVDLKRGRVSIQQTLIMVGYEVRTSTPKTKAGRRQIAIDPATVAALRAHRARQLQDRLEFGEGYAENGLVFTREDGTPLHPSATSKLFDALVAKSGLRPIRLHDLRHTHATLALQAGVHPKVVSERLGHANISITLDVYSHAIPAMQEDAASTVAAMIFGGP